MINKINSLGNVYGIKSPSFKSEEKTVSKPEGLNPAMDASPAFASYGMYTVNASKKFHVDVLKPILEDDDIDKVKGEKIYDSKGKLFWVVDENDTTKTIYYPDDDGDDVKLIRTFDKNTNKLIYEEDHEDYMNGDTDNEILVRKFSSKTGKLTNTTWYENGKAWSASKYSYKDDGTEVIVTKDLSDNSYNVSEVNADKKTRKDFDLTPDLKYVTVNVSQTVKNVELNKRAEFYDGGLIQLEERKVTNMPNLMGLEPAKDMDLKVDIPREQAEKYKEIFATAKDKEGLAKTYYSNGAIETAKLCTDQGCMTVTYRPDGVLSSAEVPNGKMKFNDENIEIINNLPDGAKKTTVFWEKGDTVIKYEKDGRRKEIGYDGNDKLVNYHEKPTDDKNDSPKVYLWYDNGMLVNAHNW